MSGTSTVTDPPKSRSYTTLREKFVSLMDDKRKALFDELLVLGREEAKYAARYFCLAGEEYKSHEELAQEEDPPKGGNTAWRNISVVSVICYLDPTHQASKQAMAHADAIQQWVLRKRDEQFDTHEQAEQLEKLKEFGISALPEDMSPRYLDFYVDLLTAWRKNEFAELSGHPRLMCLLATRWGFEDGHFYTLEEIAGVQELTRERIRQMEEKALRLLGIKSRPRRGEK